MDPYLEEYWLDVHHRLIVYSCDALQHHLPAGLRARIEERVFVERQDGEARPIYPDVHVIESPIPGKPRRSVHGDILTAEPLVIQVSHEPISQGYIQIIDAGSGGQVVSLIEFLSPSNKVPGDGRKLYLRKREEAMAAGANVVEIDLTRSGDRILYIPPDRLPPSHRTTYQVCAWRAARPDRVEVYPVPLRERLPAIRVPLRENDPDGPLDLQALVDRCCEAGRYDETDYRIDPRPPLEASDASWAADLLKSKGLRP